MRTDERATLRAVKFHRNLALAVVDSLQQTLRENKVAARVLEQQFARNPRWGKRDRAFVAEATYEIMRWRRWLEWAVPSADEWALLAAQILKSGVTLPDWDEFATFDAAVIKSRLEETNLTRAVRQSIPDWLDQLGEREFGAGWDDEIAALNKSAPVVLRANTLKISRDELKARLAATDIVTECIEGVPDALQLRERRAITSNELYKTGFFEFQDAASQLVAPSLRVEAGQRVLDACAGAGGKTLHLAALMENRGQILAFDVESQKLVELRRRAARSGVSIAGVMQPDSHDASQLHGHFDRVLIDAPCSGLGTLRRQPDLKWRLSPEFLGQIQQKQREILEFYSPMLKAGGFLVYATCSILPDENERQIEWFLRRHSHFELENSRSISPAATGFDGFFMARLRKK